MLLITYILDIFKKNFSFFNIGNYFIEKYIEKFLNYPISPLSEGDDNWIIKLIQWLFSKIYDNFIYNNIMLELIKKIISALADFFSFILHLMMECYNIALLPPLLLIFVATSGYLLARSNVSLNIVAFSMFNFVFLFYLMLFFFHGDKSLIGFYFYKCLYKSDIWPFALTLGIDNFNIFFLILTAFLFPLAVLINWNMKPEDFKLFFLLCAILEFLLILAFMSTNLLSFFFFFESTLIPMYFIISLWGSRERKIHASYYFFIYTAWGSVFIFAAILILYSLYGTLDIKILSNIKIEYKWQLFIFILLFIGFAIKIPIPPFHIWLPEAHVEASTAGSVILAGVLLKLGTFGILRFVLPICPAAAIELKEYIYAICCFSVLYISAIAIRQTDLKKIIAYSSVAHMSFVVVALFSFTIDGISGSIYLMISHGVISAALFSAIGILYDRYKTRDILYYKNITESMPVFSFFFFLFILGNIGFPFTSGFIGEFIILSTIIESNILLMTIFVFSTFLTSIYSIWLITRTIFFVSPINKTKSGYIDLNKREFHLMLYVSFFMFSLGFFPNIILLYTDNISAYYLNKLLT
jgi:proton-translocating NADH-quinone oxidoreductase chain M